MRIRKLKRMPCLLSLNLTGIVVFFKVSKEFGITLSIRPEKHQTTKGDGKAPLKLMKKTVLIKLVLTKMTLVMMISIFITRKEKMNRMSSKVIMTFHRL